MHASAATGSARERCKNRRTDIHVVETVLAGAQQTAATAIAALPREPDPIVGKALIVIADRDRLHVLPAMSRVAGVKFGDMSNTEFLLPLKVQSEQEAADAIVQGGYSTTRSWSRRTIRPIPISGMPISSSSTR